MSSIGPRYDYSRRSMSSCTVLDPLGAQVVYRRCSGEDVLGESTSYIFKFYLFLTLLRNFNSASHAGTFLFGGRH
jgi:hypothetical protein